MLTPETISALWIAAAGATVGGLISLLIQLGIFWRENRQKSRESRDLFRQKLLDLYLDIGKSKEALERISEIAEDAKRRVADGEVSRLSLGLDSFFTHVEPRKMAAEELFFLVTHTKNIDISSVHRFLDDTRTILRLLEEFRIDKKQLLTLLPGRVVGAKVEFGELTEVELQLVEPTIAHLDMLANIITREVPNATKRGAAAMASMEIVLKEYLGISFSGKSTLGQHS